MSSKYDVVKLKVLVKDDHYYILSRFNLSKTLMFCRVPSPAAEHISLDVKKYFINQNRLTITQSELEEVLCATMLSYSFSATNTSLLPLMTRFYTERVPLIVFVSGCVPYASKSLTRTLSARLNCNTVLSTEMLLDMYYSLPTAQNSTSDETVVDGATENDPFLQLWESNCQHVSALVASEVAKGVNEGKVLLIDGAWLDLCRMKPYLNASFQQQHRCICCAFQLSCTALAWEMAEESGMDTTLYYSRLFGIDNDPNSKSSEEDTETLHRLQRLAAYQESKLFEAYVGNVTCVESRAKPHHPAAARSVYAVLVNDLLETDSAADNIHDILLDRIISVLGTD